MRNPVVLAILFLVLLSACTPTSSMATSSSRTTAQSNTRTAGSGYRNSGLSKHTDQFTGKMVCEQKVTSLRDRHNLTLTARLDAHGVYTFGITRHNVREWISTPYSEAGLLLRFPDSRVIRGYVVADNDLVFDFDHDKGTIGHQTFTLIVRRTFFHDLVGANQAISYRLVDEDDATRNSIDGVLSAQHIAPLRAFSAQCF